MKKKRMLPIAIMLLIISLILVTTASYAWISLSKAVSSRGMALEMTAPNNLLISTDTTTWASTVTALNVTGGFKIYPSSSSNGYEFYALTDDGNVINGDNGGVLNDFNIDKLKFKTSLAPVTTTSDGYYTSYTLFIKTLGSDNVDIYVADLISRSASHETGENIDDCMRIAIFKDTASAENLVGIYDAGIQDEVHPIDYITGTTATLYKVEGVISDPKVLTGSSGPKITIPGGGASYVTLIVNVWIEGQNYKCINTIAGDTFQIDLKFDAVQPTT